MSRIDWSKPLRTRDGRSAVLVSTKGAGCGDVPYSRRVRVNVEAVYSYTENGFFWGNELNPTPEDLFNVEETMTKLDLTRPVQTRDGRKVRVLCTDSKGYNSIVTLVQFDDGEVVHTYRADGMYHNSSGRRVEAFDLVNVSERVRGFINVYEGCITSNMHDSREHANAMARHGDKLKRVACIEVNVEKGHGLTDD